MHFDTNAFHDETKATEIFCSRKYDETRTKHTITKEATFVYVSVKLTKFEFKNVSLITVRSVILNIQFIFVTFK